MLDKIRVAVPDAAGLVLAANVHSPIDMPPFPQSAMDGYAIKFNGKAEFELIDEVKAGDNHQPEIKPGKALRIFTGAAVPKSADAVVRQEDTAVVDGVLQVNPLPKPMANIRPQAEQNTKGDVALKAGHTMNSASIGYLTMLGIETVEVYRKPKVAIATTGNELVSPGKPLQFGQIYESNGVMLKSALKKIGIEQVDIHAVKDDFEETKALLKVLIEQNDVLLCSGGISVGDYDYVGKALLELGVEEIFYRVNQKPGKPIFFGKKGEKLVFALPGNPASALTGFHVYVTGAIQRLMGYPDPGLARNKKQISRDYLRKGDRAEFLKALITGNTVEILEGQSSAMLYTFALANALVYVPAEVRNYATGDEVECIMLP